jgi:hypothetical protein
MAHFADLPLFLRAVPPKLAGQTAPPVRPGGIVGPAVGGSNTPELRLLGTTDRLVAE